MSEAVLGRPLALPPHAAAGQPPPVQLVWPTEAQVAESFEGWAAGLSVPGYAHNVRKPFLQGLWSRWGGELGARQRAMPHIKTYCRCVSPCLRVTRVCCLYVNLKRPTTSLIHSYPTDLHPPSITHNFAAVSIRHPYHVFQAAAYIS